MSSLPLQIAHPGRAHPGPTGLDPATALAMLNAVRAAIPRIPDADEEAVQADHWLATKALGDLKPTNAVEAMWAAQATAAHFAALDAYRQAADTRLPPELAHVLRRGANATARLSRETAQILDQRRLLRRARGRAPDAMAQAVAAAAGAKIPPSPRPDGPAEAAHEMEARRKPLHEDPPADTPAGATGEARLAPTLPNSSAATESQHEPMHQNLPPARSHAATAVPAWLAAAGDDASAARIATLSIEELLALTERMVDLSQAFLACPAPDPDAPGTAAA